MACLPCFKDNISCGNDLLIIAATLAPGIDIKWVLTTPQGAEYSAETITDNNGNFTIDVTALPEGLLNPYAGLFTLEVFEQDAYQCNQLTWNDSAYCTPYTCISFDIVNGNNVKNSLGCPCDLI